jgi:dTDP-4-dehydrorhamnose 3,5-epimerase
MIKDVNQILLNTYPDERGFFREIIKSNNEAFNAGFGQLSHSLVYSGIVKAWHGHKYQTQYNYVVTGLIKAVLYDNRPDSLTYKETIEFLIGENFPPMLYSFPSGVLHGYKCLHGPMNIIYITSGQYDPSEEIRIPYNDPTIGYDWISVIVK